MKKKCFYSGMTYLFCHSGANLLLVRTQILLFFFVFLLPLSGVASPLQEIRITIQQKNVPLSKVFKEIEEKTDCSFLIRNNDVNTNENRLMPRIRLLPKFWGYFLMVRVSNMK